MRLAVTAAGIGVVFILACGGGAKDGASESGSGSVEASSTAGPYATTLGSHLASENELPCPVYGPGEEVTLGDSTLIFAQTEVMEPENRLPWVSNSDERSRFSGDDVMAMAIPFQVRNNSPVKVAYDIAWHLHTTDGERVRGGAYISGLYQDREGRVDIWDEGKLTPGVFYETANVYAVNPAFASGSALHLYLEEQQRDATDPRGRMIDVMIEQVVVDLGPTTEGVSLHQAEADRPPPRVKPRKR